jgi:hypothetical protein
MEESLIKLRRKIEVLKKVAPDAAAHIMALEDSLSELEELLYERLRSGGDYCKACR